MKRLFYLITHFLFLKTTMAQSFIPKVHYGKTERQTIASKFITPRSVDVWMPDDYSPKNKYAVLYMHDGQMLFDETQTWNKKSWHIDSIAATLMRKKGMQSFIVVAVWNDPQTRHADYFPQKPFENLTSMERDTVTAQLQRSSRIKDVFNPISDQYLQFLVTELKPYIDKNYATYINPENTFIAGSSMGGLISMYAICEYPNVFGGAACMSTHWPGTSTTDNNPIPNAFLNYMSAHLPNPKNHKIYFDYGDQTLDAMYPPLQKKVDSVMTTKGYSNANWMTKFYPGDNHSEVSWNKRFHIPVTFLLKK